MSGDEKIELCDIDAGTPREQGEQQGERLGEQACALFGLRWRLLRLRSRIRDVDQLHAKAQAHVEVLRSFDGDLSDELNGFARASGLEPWQLVILNHYTDFRDIPPDDGGCSVVYAPLLGGNVSAQTWDMHGTAEPFVTLLRLKPRDAPPVVLFTLTGCLGMTGLNALGVSVCINNLTPNDARVGILWPALVRRMLRERTAEAALEVLMRAQLSSGHNYLIADRARAFNVETTGVEKRVTFRDASAWYWHTNHYLDPELRAFEVPALSTSTTCDRFETLTGKLASSTTRPADIDALWTLLGSHDGLPRSLCSHLQGDDPAASKTCGAIICDPTRSHILARRGCINGASYRVVEVEA